VAKPSSSSVTRIARRLPAAPASCVARGRVVKARQHLHDGEINQLTPSPSRTACRKFTGGNSRRAPPAGHVR